MDASDDINSLEAKALVRSLLAFRDHVRNSRVDIHTDNLTLKAALDISAARIHLLTILSRKSWSVAVS